MARFLGSGSLTVGGLTTTRPSVALLLRRAQLSFQAGPTRSYAGLLREQPKLCDRSQVEANKATANQMIPQSPSDNNAITISAPWVNGRPGRHIALWTFRQ
jgi:hypothetical protein